MIKKTLVIIFIVFGCAANQYAETNRLPSQVVKFDIFLPTLSLASSMIFSMMHQRLEITFIAPVEYQWAFTGYTALNLCIWNYYLHDFFYSDGDYYSLAIGAGVSVFPFGKAPDGFYIGADVLYSLNSSLYCMVVFGYQFVFDNHFVLDLRVSKNIFDGAPFEDSLAMCYVFLGFAF